VKIWFQNKRSKFKKSSKRGASKHQQARDGGDDKDAGNFSADEDDLNNNNDEEDENSDSENSDDESELNTDSKSADQICEKSEPSVPESDFVKKETTIDSGISGSSSPSYNHSNVSVTPPLGDNWTSPYSGQKENQYNQYSNFGMSLIQPLSSSSPSYSKLNYIQPQQQLNQQQQQYSQQQFSAYNHHGYYQNFYGQTSANAWSVGPFDAMNSFPSVQN